MKRNLIAVAIAVFTLTAATAADARPRPHSGGQFEANKTFGLGVMIGAPTAISGKYFLSRDTALDFGIGTYYQYRGDGLHIHGDFLWHPVVIAKADAFWLPLYFGIGARFFDHRNNHVHIGPRVPVGISFDFQNVPLDVFLELAFAFDVIIIDRPNNDFRADVGLALGIRYWFD